ncbi:hypothetical protein [Rummeliibacillus pycnus]|uniref:hypothetical protein n=1 Tax=Rummeliibacillus pycnus TaxID=101070 RepID=UPI003D2C8E10
MIHLTEKDCINIKYELQKGRLTIPGIRTYLLGVLLYSGFTVGVSLFAATGNNVGWETLSSGWHTIYYIEMILFAINILIILFCWKINNINQKILVIAIILFTYKTALDQYIAILMFSKDRDIYDFYAPLVLMIIAIGFIVQIIVLRNWIKGIEGINKLRNKKTKKKLLFPVLFLFAVLVGTIFNNNLFMDKEIAFIFVVASVVYIAMLIGQCEFIIAAYCVFRFPSFAVNSPQKKQQYLNNKKQKKKKRKRNNY